MVYNGSQGPIQARSIGERQNISQRYIEQIFQKLRKEGIVKSVRGPLGGYRLARRPDKISIGDVIRAVTGGDLRLVFCEGSNNRPHGACRRLGKCVVSEIWGEASKNLMDYFNSVTVESICEEARERGMEI
jgi:Rrf2 family protein